MVQKSRCQLPIVAGKIERRILVNFRCRAEALRRILPPPFRPQLIHGWGMGGICLIRLSGLRPAFLPALGGLRSENAAHRIAVEWEDETGTHEGVFIPRRNSNALFNQIAGGKLFPGIHHAAEFRVQETRERFDIEMRSKDGKHFVSIQARTAAALPDGSIFHSLGEASEFFQRGGWGWSFRRNENTFDGLELNCHDWSLEPLAVERAESSFFGNRELFPEGAAMFDSAFLMRDIAHEWHSRGQLKEANT